MKRLLLTAAIVVLPGPGIAQTFPFGPTVQCSSPETQSFISKEMAVLTAQDPYVFKRLTAVPQQQSQSSCLIIWADQLGSRTMGTFTYEYDPAAEIQHLPPRLILNYQGG
jgi:hypothetical protein